MASRAGNKLTPERIAYLKQKQKEATARKREQGLPTTKGAVLSSVQRTARKEQRKQALLNHVADGRPIKEAVALVGVSMQAYGVWRRDDKVWADTVSSFVKRNRNSDISKVLSRTFNGEYPQSEFVTFRKTYFDRDTSPHHMLLIDAIESAKPGELVAVLGFPGMGKTQTLVDYLCWRVAEDPNVRAAVISEGQTLARDMLRQIATRMTEPQRFPAFISRYGPFRAPIGSVQKDYIGRVTGNPWTADEIRVFKASHDEKEMTITSKGVGSTLYGGRYDFMLYDDLVSTRNLNQTESILRWLRQDALTRPGHEDGGHVFIGSRVGRGDLYSTMTDQGMLDKIVTIPALDRWVDRDEMFTVENDRIVLNPDCPAKPTWDKWSLPSLAQRRKLVGEEIWSRTYMQREFTPHDATFTEAMLDKAKDRGLTLGQQMGTYTILSIDPALDTGVCAFLIAGCSSDKMWLRDLHLKHDIRRYEDIFAHIASLAAQYRPSMVVIEQNNFQRGLLQDDRLMALKAKFGFKVEPHQTGRNKNDSVMGVAMMASAFSDGELHIPWYGETERARFGPLIDELRTWMPTKRGAELKMDAVMAMWFAWLSWSSRRKIMGEGNVIRRQVPSWMNSSRRGIA